MSFLAKDWVVILGVGSCVFFICYLWLDKIINLILAKSIGTRKEMVHLLRTMYVDVNEKRISYLLWLLSFGLGILVFLLCWPSVTLGLLFGSAVGLLGWNLPLSIIRNIYTKRQTKFVDQMVDGLTIMSNAMKSGMSIDEAMKRVVVNLKNPIRQEFSEVLSQVSLGSTVEDALLQLGERIPKPDVQMFVIAVTTLLSTAGSNLSETFATIAFVIRERQKVEKKIETSTAKGVRQGIIVSVVPFAMVGIFFILDPNYIMPLFSSAIGWFLLTIALGLQIFAGLLIRKIVTIEV